MKNDIKAIIFDNDGTIVDTHDVILNSMRYMTRKVLDKEFSDHELMAQVGLPLKDQMPYFTNDKNLQDKMVDIYRQHNETTHETGIKSFGGCKECLQDLKNAGYKLAIATSKLRTVCERGLQVLNIRELFDGIVGCEDTEKHKPQAEPLLYCANKLNISINKCIYIGDAPFDIQAANAAKCKSVAVTWGMFDEEVLRKENPTYIVRNFSELKNLFI